jgi:hypothetical protein
MSDVGFYEDENKRVTDAAPEPNALSYSHRPKGIKYGHA